MPEPTTLDGYIRVSQVRGRDGESFISPAVQRDQIQQWANLRGVTIGEWHTDLDQTGGTLSRPALDAMLERIRNGQTSGVVVARLDRLSRAGVADALKLVQDLSDQGAQLAVVDLGIDPTTMFGEFAMTIMLALARMERRRIAENWATAQARAVARGVHIASKTPTGYLRRQDGRLEPDPDAAPTIAEVFRMRANGSSWREIADYLDGQGVVGPYGSPQWATRAATHIIENRVYLGEARSGENVNRTAHEPIIDRATWDAAQQARGVSVPRSSREPAALAGLLRCAGCRFLLKPDRMTSHTGERLRIYRCRGRHAAGTCADRVATLERVVWPHVEAAFLALDDARVQLAGTNHAPAEIKALEVRAATADAELAAYRDDERIADTLGRGRYVEGLRARVAQADAAHAAVAARRGPSSALPVDLALRDLWPDLDVTERLKLMGEAWACIVLRSGRHAPIEDRVLFVPAGVAPADLPRRGKRFPLRPWGLDDPGAVWKPAPGDLEEG